MLQTTRFLGRRGLNLLVVSVHQHSYSSTLDKLFPKSQESTSQLLFDSAKAGATYIKFLDLIEQSTYGDPFINRAINRYIKYFELAEDMYKKEQYSGLKKLVPTRDISLIWATHMIHPHHYRAWRKQHFDGSDEGKLAFNTWYENQCIRIQQHEIEKPIVVEWRERYQNTERLWKEKFGEEYLLPNTKLPKQKKLLTTQEIRNKFDIDLHAATKRHLRFGNRVIRLKPIINRGYLESAAERYEQFLKLGAEMDTVVPTLDIDIIWHSHMLSPVDYFTECKELAGRVLDHKDELPSSELEVSFTKTKDVWNKKYKSEMVKQKKKKDNSPHVTNNNSTAACASCGFGDSHFHHNHSVNYNAIESGFLENANESFDFDKEFFSEDTNNWTPTSDATFDDATPDTSKDSLFFSWDFFSNFSVTSSSDVSDSGSTGSSSCGGSSCSSCGGCSG